MADENKKTLDVEASFLDAAERYRRGTAALAVDAERENRLTREATEKRAAKASVRLTA